MTDDQELREIMDGPIEKLRYPIATTGVGAPALPNGAFYINTDTQQWSVLGDDKFRATGPTCRSLPAGMYAMSADQFGPYLTSHNVKADDLVELTDSAHQNVLHGIRKFWQSK